MGHPAPGNTPKKREWVGLPPRPFMYTIDQIGTLLELEERTLRSSYCWFDGRQVGAMPKDRLRTVNIAPLDASPDWRVSEQELIRWMQVRKFRYYERGWVR